MSLKIIDRNIRTITGNISKLNDLIHVTGVLILEHTAAHGDCTRALVLVKAMPASFRRNLLVNWFERNSPIRISLTNDKVGMLKDTAKLYTPFDIDAAKALPFYVEQTKDGGGEAKTYGFDNVATDRDSFVKRWEKRIEDGAVAEDDVASVQAALATLKALSFERVVPAALPALNPRANVKAVA